MEFLIPRKALLAGVELVRKATKKSNPKPILQCLKIVARGDTLELLATDLEVGISHTLRVDRAADGAVCVPAAEFAGILKKMSDEDVLVRTDEDGLRIDGNEAEFHLPVENADDFPDIPAFTASEYHEVEAGTLARMLDLTSGFAAKKSNKFAITGTLLELNGKLVAVATDNNRLASIAGPCTKAGDPKDATALIPTKAAKLIEAVCDKLAAKQLVRVAVNQRQVGEDSTISVHGVKVPIMAPVEVVFQSDLTTIYSRMVEGRYPPYREIFPKKIEREYYLPVGELAANVRQVASACDAESNRVTFEFADERLTLSAQSPTKGASKMTMLVSGLGALRINFCPRFILELCRKFGKKDTLTVQLVDGKRPAMFRVGDYQHLVMPIS